MIASVSGFAEYFEGVRRRTREFFGAIPAERVDWAPKAGEYSCGDIVRHVAASEAVEHEVHHRSQLASYLTSMGIEAPDIFGLGVEDVERLTAPAAAGRDR